MPVEWTGLSPDVLLRLDREAPATLGAQLQDQLRDAIRTGRLGDGERLPSSRTLAQELGVSRGLIVDVFAQLEAEGYLISRSGSATRVNGAAACDPCTDVAPAPPDRLDIHFKYGTPDLARVPVQDWLWALTESARTAPFDAWGYGDARGLESVRDVIASYLRRVRGAAITAADLVVCGGYQQGLGSVLAALVHLDVEMVATEDPHSVDDDDLIRRAGRAAVHVPVDERGLDVDALAATPARAVIVTPAHQAPTGVVLAPERRQALVAWAHACDGYIIEDDYDAEYRYDRQPVGSMQGLAPDRVVSIGSVSKSIAPALRLGWIACPRQLTAAVAAEKHLSVRMTPGLDQLALAELIRSGRYDRHLRRMRTVYAARREALTSAIAEHAPSVRVGGLAAGLHAVLHLPDGVDEAHVVAATRERSIGVYGMSGWRADRSTTPPQLVIGFGNVHEAAIRRGIATIADLLQGS